MPYRGRHRQVVCRPQRLRRTSTVAAALATALIAPLALSGPVSSTAEETANAPLTLAQFLVPDGVSRYADDVARLLAKANAAGVAIDRARLQVYEVPTVQGPTRYITASPESFVVTVNPNRLYRFPTVGDARDVESSLGPVTLDPGGVYGTVTGAQSAGAPSLRVITALLLDVWSRLDPNHLPNIEMNELAADLQRIIADSLGGTTGPETLVRTVEGWLANLLPSAVTTAIREVLYPVLGDLFQTLETVYTVVPMANASLPINTDTSIESPNIEADSTLWNYAPLAYNSTREEDTPPPAKWQRNNDDCYDVTTGGWFRTVCWHIWNQSYDRNSAYTYWQFHMEASSSPRDGHFMIRTWVEGKPMTEKNAEQYWDGKLPEPNTTVGGGGSSCTTQTKGLQMGSGEPVLLAASWEVQYLTCENLVPRQYGEQGHWATTWHRNPNQEPRDMRHTAFTMPVKTYTSNDLPGWWLYDGTEVDYNWP